jgi:hypothetical protein
MSRIKTSFFIPILSLLIAASVMAATPADYYNAGINAYKQGDYKKAIAFITAAAKLDNKNPKYYKAVGMCYQKLGDQASASKFFNYVAKLSVPAAGAAAVKSKGVVISVFGGFTTVTMAKANGLIEGYSGTGVTLGLLGPGFIVGGQAGFAVIPGLYLGPRIEFISASSRTSAKTFLGDWAFDYTTSIIPLMAGATYLVPVSEGAINLGGQLYLGYGLANASMDWSGTASASPTLKLGGGGLVIDAGATVAFNITDIVSLGLVLGYRMANVAEMKFSEDYYGAKKGEVAKGSNNEAVPFDFSGFIADVNLNFSF